MRGRAANIETRYGYNFGGLMTELYNRKNGNFVSQFKYTYDIDGNQKTKLNGELETAYEYDGLGRLTAEREVNGNTYLYDYDAFSNRSSLTVSGIDNYTTAYEYDLNNRLLTETRTDKDCTEVAKYSYDNNGSQIRRASEVTEGKKPWSKPEQHLFVTEPKKNGKATLDVRTYNGFGQLIEVYRDGQKISFAYRPDGMRHSKTVTYPFKPLLNRKTTHVWDGQNIVLEINSKEKIKAIFLRGLSLISQLIGEDAFYYLHNAHGDVVQRIAENGTSAPQYKYDAFGNQRNIVDTDPNPFRYCGEYFDIETQELYLRARQYDPSTGRFLREDVAKDGNNWYTYCKNNPIKYCDPSGNYSKSTKVRQQEILNPKPPAPKTTFGPYSKSTKVRQAAINQSSKPKDTSKQQIKTNTTKPWWHYPKKVLNKIGQTILAVPDSIYLGLGLGVGAKGSGKVNIFGLPVDLTLGTNLDLIYIQRKPGKDFEVGERSVYFEGSFAGDITGIGSKNGYFHPFRDHDCTNENYKNDRYNYDYSQNPCPETEVYNFDDPSYDVKLGAGAELYTPFGGGGFEIGFDLEYLVNRWITIWSTDWD